MMGNEEGRKRTPVSQARGQRQTGASGCTANIQGAGANVGHWTMSREGSHECPHSAGVCAGTMVAGAMGTSD